MKNSPYDKYKIRQPMANNSGTGGNLDFLNAVVPTDNSEQKKLISQMKRESTLVELPKHLYIPENATSLDLRKLVTLAPSPDPVLLFRFVAPQGAVTRFISYGVFNDGEDASLTELLPLVDGARVFPYHGDPSDNYKISLGLSPDLSNTSLIPCQLTLLPNQVLEWYVTNNSTVNVDMGVRMVGYFDAAEKQVTPKFGG